MYLCIALLSRFYKPETWRLVNAFIIIYYHIVTRFRASSNGYLTGVSEFTRIRCSIHESQQRSVTLLQDLHFVSS